MKFDERSDKMGRPKEPIEILVAKGKSHLTKAQIEERREQEIKVPFKNVKAPSYLDAKQKKKFKEIADKLLDLGVMTELDIDCLAHYVLSHSLYLAYTRQIENLANEDELKALKDYQLMQDKAFKQCLACARELGLTVTARAKLIIPPNLDLEDDEL